MTPAEITHALESVRTMRDPAQPPRFHGRPPNRQFDGDAMTGAAIAAVRVACDDCGSEPCLRQGFCQACRDADARMRQQRPTENHPARPTPRTTIEAIMWCVRERDPQALHEPGNIERLSRCDVAAIAEIDARIRKPKSGHAP
jgi:hypothetical protein